MNRRGPTAPVRVLQLIKGLGPGGAERLVLTLAQLADGSRVDLHVAYLLPWKHHLVAEIRATGAPVTCLQAGRVADLRWLLRLRRLVREQRIEIVHVHSPLVAALARVALRLPGRGRALVVGTEHNVWSSHRAPTRWANRATHPLEVATLAVSEQVRDSMAPRVRARAEVVVHGADVQAIAARRGERDTVRKELGLGDDELVVVNVANLRGTKDHRTLLEAAHLLRSTVPGVRFLNVGQGPLAAELTKLRDRLGIGDTFEFLGYQEDPIRVLVAADVFCLSSRFEGLSIALVEAMAAGLPAVVTAVGGMPTVVRDGVEGCLVPPGDPAALADALRTMEDPERRRAYGTAAAARAEQFGAHRAVDREQELYEQLTGRRR